MEILTRVGVANRPVVVPCRTARRTLKIFRVTRMLFVLALALSSALPVQADTKIWACADNYWHIASCWATTGTPGVPVLGDDVIAGTFGANDTFLRFNSTTGTGSANSLLINSNTANTIGLVQTGGSLTITHDEIVGSTGTGSFTQSGGTNTVSGPLYLGNSSGSDGSYDLSGTGSLSAATEVVGVSGSGSFTQSGGTNTMTNHLDLGGGNSGNGTYALSGTGSLSAFDESVGYSGTGSFTQSGGTNTVSTYLYLGNNSGSSGTYDLSGGSLSAVNERVGGIGGTGSFTQSGGTNTVSGDLYLGFDDGSSGTYTVSGGSVAVSGALSLGGETASTTGTGTLTVNNGGEVTAGSVKVWNGASSVIQNGGVINVGSLDTAGAIAISGGVFTSSASNATGSIQVTGGTLLLNGGGTHDLSGQTSSTLLSTIQGEGAGTIVNLSGTVTNGGTLNANAGATINLTGGLTMPNSITNATAGGRVNVQNGATLAGGFAEADGTSSVVDVQSGGTVNNTILQAFNGGNLNIDGTVNGGSVRTIYGGTLTGSGTINASVFNSNGGGVGPGDSPGIMHITGDYSQDASSSLFIELGGLVAGSEYDLLDVSGTATLDGTLDVSLFDLGSGLFTPHLGDSFDILTADLIQGSFGSLTLAALDPGLTWDIGYLTDAIGSTDVVRLSVVNAVPIPPAVWLFGSGLLGLVFVARRHS